MNLFRVGTETALEELVPVLQRGWKKAKPEWSVAQALEAVRSGKWELWTDKQGNLIAFEVMGPVLFVHLLVSHSMQVRLAREWLNGLARERNAKRVRAIGRPGLHRLGLPHSIASVYDWSV